MALNASATINVSTLAAYVAPSGTPTPTLTPEQLAAFDFDADTITGNTEYKLMGHTSDGTDVTISAEITGGETLASRQRAALRRTPIRAAYSVGIAALQFDNQMLSIWFGGGDTTDADVFGIPKQYQVADRALFIVMADAEANLALGFTKTELSPEGEISFGPSALSEMGLTAAILDDDAAEHLGVILRDGLGATV